MSWPGDLWGEIVSFAIQQYPHSKTYIPFLQEWWRFDSEAPWRLPANRPGPSPFKAGGSPFHIIPGGTSPERIRPDICLKIAPFLLLTILTGFMLHYGFGSAAKNTTHKLENV